MTMAIGKLVGILLSFIIGVLICVVSIISALGRWISRSGYALMDILSDIITSLQENVCLIISGVVCAAFFILGILIAVYPTFVMTAADHTYTCGLAPMIDRTGVIITVASDYGLEPVMNTANAGLEYIQTGFSSAWDDMEYPSGDFVPGERRHWIIDFIVGTIYPWWHFIGDVMRTPEIVCNKTPKICI